MIVQVTMFHITGGERPITAIGSPGSRPLWVSDAQGAAQVRDEVVRNATLRQTGLARDWEVSGAGRSSSHPCSNIPL
jgi:hypothetical protein